MWIKITPKKTNDSKAEQLRALGIIAAEQLHVQASDISTVAFAENVAQIRLSSGGIITTEVLDEIARLKRLVEGESLESEKTLGERLPDIMARAWAATLEDFALTNANHTLRA